MIEHPLTDEILCSKFPEHIEYVERPTFDHIADGMRAAYDLGRDDQLEQVIKWLEDCPIYDSIIYRGEDMLAQDLKQAMRPQENN
jgi:hypothetical protein